MAARTPTLRGRLEGSTNQRRILEPEVQGGLIPFLAPVGPETLAFFQAETPRETLEPTLPESGTGSQAGAA